MWISKMLARYSLGSWKSKRSSVRVRQTRVSRLWESEMKKAS